MTGNVLRIYRATRKKHDQLFNVVIARPIAAGIVALLAPTPVTPNQLTIFNLLLFVGGTALLIFRLTFLGALLAVAVLTLSYLFDCADGMLARHKNLASTQGHLFDFFIDEIKAVMLTAGLALRLWQTGGLGLNGRRYLPGDATFLVAGVGGVFAVASAISLTNFLRRPEISGQATKVEAHYEQGPTARSTSWLGRSVQLAMTFLRFLAHYPSHLWLFALLERLDVFFWLYGLLHTLYLIKGWLGLIRRFGRF